MKERHIGLDVLRIFLALMVTSIHFIWSIDVLCTTFPEGIAGHFLLFLKALCFPAVNSYILISGYFSFANRKTFPQILKRLLQLWFCLLFAQMLGYTAALATHHDSFNFLTLFKRFFPLSRGIWWFMSVYFAMMALSPALNWVLDNLTKRQYLVMMSLSLIICSIIPFFARFESPLGLTFGAGGLIWFIVLYLTGGGLYKFYSINSSKQGRLSLFTIGGYIFFTLYLYFSPTIHNTLGISNLTSYSYNSIIVYVQAVMLFLFFRGIKIGNIRASRAISFIAGLSFSTYIYHCQEDVIHYFWQYLLPERYAEGSMLLVAFSALVLGVYLLSFLIEMARRSLFSLGDLENKALNRVMQWITPIIAR